MYFLRIGVATQEMKFCVTIEIYSKSPLRNKDAMMQTN